MSKRTFSSPAPLYLHSLPSFLSSPPPIFLSLSLSPPTPLFLYIYVFFSIFLSTSFIFSLNISLPLYCYPEIMHIMIIMFYSQCSTMHALMGYVVCLMIGCIMLSYTHYTHMLSYKHNVTSEMCIIWLCRKYEHYEQW